MTDSNKKITVSIVCVASLYLSYKLMNRRGFKWDRFINMNKDPVLGLPPFSETTMNIVEMREKEVQTDSEPSAPPVDYLTNPLPTPPQTPHHSPPPTPKKEHRDTWFDRVIHFNFY